ncbi:MAG TPA: cytochrome C [Chthoniobacterales bacterium]|nr:cytochrome C [Chthoniobacterales bacterium]
MDEQPQLPLDDRQDTAQVFRPRANLFYRGFLIVLPVFLLTVGYVWYKVYRSPYRTGVLVPVGQPVLFSHRHHAGDLKLDCRYCHTSVERSSFAGLPPTQTCMTCHSQIFTDSALLRPVLDSYTSGRPIRWNRVHNLPDYVYFNHAIHVNKGVGCSTCHGQVNEMPLVWKTQTLFMEWCLSCHRHPEANLRPIKEIFNLSWKPSKTQPLAGAQLAKDYHLDTPHLTNCSVCHH